MQLWINSYILDDVNCRSNWVDKNVTMSRILTDDDYSFFAIKKFLKIIEH